MPTHDKPVGSEIRTTYSENNGSVTVEKGFTVKTGDYEVAKVLVGATLPINPTKEQISQARKTIRITEELVDDEIGKQLDAINESLKPKKGR